MFRVWGWSVWAVLPIFGLAFHFGPGQNFMKRDLAMDQIQVARQAESEAARLQAIAYAAQFKTISARAQLLHNDNDANRQELDHLLKAEQKAYSDASDAWKLAADRYQQVESLLEGTDQAYQVRWLRGRALVRAGEVFNGIEELHATLAEALQQSESVKSAELVVAAREELAAAHYYGARLLREEGRSADVWRTVSETSRQQFRYLAEKASTSDSGDASQILQRNLQRNLERVLDLEQQDRSELVGRPIPKDSPRARRPGDGEPSKRPGIGPPRGDRPGNGASGMMEIGDGW